MFVRIYDYSNLIILNKIREDKTVE